MIRARSHKKWYTVTNRVVYTKEDKELYNKARMEVMEMAALWLVGDFGGTQKDYSTSPWILGLGENVKIKILETGHLFLYCKIEF